MVAQYTFADIIISICLDPVPFNSAIQHLKVTVLYKGYNLSLVNKDLFKFQNPRLSNLSYSSSISNINAKILHSPKFNFSIAKTLKQHNFKVI